MVSMQIWLSTYMTIFILACLLSIAFYVYGVRSSELVWHTANGISHSTWSLQTNHHSHTVRGRSELAQIDDPLALCLSSLPCCHATWHTWFLVTWYEYHGLATCPLFDISYCLIRHWPYVYLDSYPTTCSSWITVSQSRLLPGPVSQISGCLTV